MASTSVQRRKYRACSAVDRADQIVDLVGRVICASHNGWNRSPHRHLCSCGECGIHAGTQNEGSERERMAKGPLNRRSFLKTAAGAVGAATQASAWTTGSVKESPEQESPASPTNGGVEAGEYPRRFRGRQLAMISFPLGGVAAGSLGLGGRGQLCNWEIFNRPNKGYRPAYAFPSIWAQAGDRPPVARVLESRILPPYEGQDGLGSNNVPGPVSA